MTDTKRIHTLEGVVASCNLEFGRRLLADGNRDRFEFTHFVRVADELVDRDPRRAAIHLAGLVALDVASEPDSRGATRRADRETDGPIRRDPHGLERG